MPKEDDTATARVPAWSLRLTLAVVLAAAFIACSRDLPDLGPTYAPLQTATPTTAVLTSAPVPTRGMSKEAVSGKVAPLQTATPTISPVPGAGPSIESVYSLVASAPGGRPLRPLFDHLPKDREPISSLARALRTAVPIAPDKLLRANDRGRYLYIRYRDGSGLTVSQVSRCEPKSNGDAGEPDTGRCDGRWGGDNDVWWVEGTGMVRSPGLSRWWEEMPELMVHIGILSLPEIIEVDEPFTITLYDWHHVIDGDSINLGLVSLDGTEIGLGTFPASDTFQGKLTVPDQTPDGRHWLRVSGGAFSELVDVVHVVNDANKGRQEVRVKEAWLQFPDLLVLSADTCNENPEVWVLQQTEADVQVLMSADAFPFRQSYPDCVEAIAVQLREPLGDRVVVDQHTGRAVSVSPFGSEETSTDEPQKAIGMRNERATRHEIAVEVAWLLAPDTLVINANTCHRDPELALFRETDADVTVKMIVGPDPYPNGGPDCLEELIVQLRKPLEDRTVTDALTGKVLSVTPVAGATPASGLQDQPESPQSEKVPPDIRESVSDAELQDLQAVAEQYGMTLREAFDRYAWNDEFSRAVQRIREAAPNTFAGAEIVDATHAWVAFTEPPPEEALDIIDAFTRKHGSILVEVRASSTITEAELEEAIPAVHYAVYKAPGVLNASTSFESATGEIVSVVVLESTASDSVLDDLRAIAEKRLVEVTRPDILDSVSVSVVRSKSPVLGSTD